MVRPFDLPRQPEQLGADFPPRAWALGCPVDAPDRTLRSTAVTAVHTGFAAQPDVSLPLLVCGSEVCAAGRDGQSSEQDVREIAGRGTRWLVPARNAHRPAPAPGTTARRPGPDRCPPHLLAPPARRAFTGGTSAGPPSQPNQCPPRHTTTTRARSIRQQRRLGRRTRMVGHARAARSSTPPLATHPSSYPPSPTSGPRTNSRHGRPVAKRLSH